MNVRPRPGTREEREQGSVSFILIGWAILLWILLAVVVDVGLAISQRERAADLADQAARAEAQNLNLNNLRTHGTVAIVKDGCERAETYLTNAAVVGTVHYGSAGLDRTFGNEGPANGPDGCRLGPGDTVTVSVDLTYSPLIFNIFGVGTITVHETGTATAQSGTQ